jgi:hypothetical protein
MCFISICTINFPNFLPYSFPVHVIRDALRLTFSVCHMNKRHICLIMIPSFCGILHLTFAHQNIVSTEWVQYTETKKCFLVHSQLPNLFIYIFIYINLKLCNDIDKSHSCKKVFIYTECSDGWFIVYVLMLCHLQVFCHCEKHLTDWFLI